MLYNEFFDLPSLEVKFLRYLKGKGRPQTTIDAYRKDLKSFKKYIYNEYDGKFLMKDLTQNDVIDYIGYLVLERGLQRSSANRHLSTLKSFGHFLVTTQGFKENIPAKIPHESVSSPLPQILTEEEVKNLLEVAKATSKYYYTLTATLYYTLSRITPIVEIKKQNIDLKEKVIFMPYIKGGKSKFIPINDKLCAILKDFLAHHPVPSSPYVFHSPIDPNDHINSDSYRKALREMTKQARIEKQVRPHLLRHTGATFLTERGVSQKALAEILGHADTRSTDVYQHLTVKNLREPINKLP